MTGRYDITAAAKALAAAVGGYGIALGLGYLLGRLADSGSYGDLAIYALTLVFFAPLGALAGAYFGLITFGPGPASRHTWSMLGVIGLGTAVSLVISRNPMSVTFGILAGALALAYASGRRERAGSGAGLTV
jgi:hypothetical protein